MHDGVRCTVARVLVLAVLRARVQRAALRAEGCGQRAAGRGLRAEGCTAGCAEMQPCWISVVATLDGRPFFPPTLVPCGANETVLGLLLRVVDPDRQSTSAKAFVQLGLGSPGSVRIAVPTEMPKKQVDKLASLHTVYHCDNRISTVLAMQGQGDA
eukprot:COSAG03_NODE_1714_length_3610_cov_5.894902_2_plen_156_part_00